MGLIYHEKRPDRPPAPLARIGLLFILVALMGWIPITWILPLAVLIVAVDFVWSIKKIRSGGEY